MLDYYGIKINVKKLNKLAKLPTRGSEYAAGYDLYAATAGPIEIQPHTTIKIGTGLSFELPQGTFAAIFPRSGIATKRGLRPANCVGVCDSDYRGEYIVAVHNDTNESQIIEPQVLMKWTRYLIQNAAMVVLVQVELNNYGKISKKTFGNRSNSMDWF